MTTPLKCGLRIRLRPDGFPLRSRSYGGPVGGQVAECGARNLLVILHLKRRSGLTLIGVMAAIVIVGLLGAALMGLISLALRESIQALEWNQAFYAAESGISAAKAYMGANADWYANSSTNTRSVGRASFTATVDTNNGQIISVGSCEDAQWTSIWRTEEIPRLTLIYRQNINPDQDRPRYRTCSNLRRLSGEQNAVSVTNEVEWQRIVASPLSNEFLLVVQEDQQWIWAQTYANGTWGSNTLLNAAGQAPAPDARGFDVAYEGLSGRGMVVYSVGSSNPQYRLWVSNSWTSASNINVGATNPVRWIRLISRPNTNEIMCLARWRKTTNPQGNYSSAIVWNGSVWTNYVPLERQCDSQIDCETLDGAYSANMALVVYINGSSAAQRQRAKYKTYTGGAWSNEKTNSAALGSDPYWIRVEYSPDGALAYACFLTVTSRRLRGAYWNGSSWGSYNTFGNVSLDTTAYRCFDIAWSSQTNTLMVTYSPNANAQLYLLATGGGISNRYGSLVSTADGQWCVLKADPLTSEFYYLALDDANDVNLQRWTGSAWALFPEMEDRSAVTYNSIDMAFRRDSAATNCWR